MRPFLAVGLCLMLARCISIPIPGGTARVGIGGGVGIGVVVSEKQIRAGLRALQQHIFRGAKKLRRVPCSAGECHPQEDVARLVNDLRRELAAAFPEDAIGLREAADAAIVAEVRRLGQPQPLDAIQTIAMQAQPSATGYTTAAVQAALERMAAGIERFLQFDRMALDLTVKSSPAEADFEIYLRDSKKSRRTGRTDDWLANVWRGIYTAMVRKDGYKEAKVDIDLINDSRTRITCTLRRQNEANDSSCEFPLQDE